MRKHPWIEVRSSSPGSPQLASVRVRSSAGGENQARPDKYRSRKEDGAGDNIASPINHICPSQAFHLSPFQPYSTAAASSRSLVLSPSAAARLFETDPSSPFIHLSTSNSSPRRSNPPTPPHHFDNTLQHLGSSADRLTWLPRNRHPAASSVPTTPSKTFCTLQQLSLRSRYLASDHLTLRLGCLLPLPSPSLTPTHLSPWRPEIDPEIFLPTARLSCSSWLEPSVVYLVWVSVDSPLLLQSVTNRVAMSKKR